MKKRLWECKVVQAYCEQIFFANSPYNDSVINFQHLKFKIPTYGGGCSLHICIISFCALVSFQPTSSKGRLAYWVFSLGTIGSLTSQSYLTVPTLMHSFLSWQDQVEVFSVHRFSFAPIILIQKPQHPTKQLFCSLIYLIDIQDFFSCLSKDYFYIRKKKPLCIIQLYSQPSYQKLTTFLKIPHG